tara:strand:+ start:41262 stop:41924 length:663 start_codon:yes stop_codon:yes gene_type:complete
MLSRITIIIFVASFLFACKKDPAPYFGYEYFPMDEGTYVEYNVMDIVHDEGGNPQHDTTRYRLRTVVGEVVEDNEGRAARKLYRYSYDQNNGELLDQRVWTQLIDGGRAEVIEENQRKIRLVFAITLDKTWDVNAFNPEEELEVSYDEIFNPYQEFDSTVTVEYEDFFSLVDYRRKYEVYANGVGLIKRSFKDLVINNFDTLDISNGTEVHYELIDYGIE